MTLASLYLVIATILEDPVGSLIALAIILAGLPLYFIFVHSRCMPRGFYARAGKFLGTYTESHIPHRSKGERGFVGAPPLGWIFYNWYDCNR